MSDISLGIIPCKSIHVAANGIISFFKAEEHATVCMCHIFFIHSFINGQLVSVSWLLYIVLQGTLGCIYSFKLLIVFSFSLDKYPEVELLDRMPSSASIFNLGGNLIPFSIVTAPIYSPTNSAQGYTRGSFFLHILINTFLVLLMTALLTGVR